MGWSEVAAPWGDRCLGERCDQGLRRGLIGRSSTPTDRMATSTDQVSHPHHPIARSDHALSHSNYPISRSNYPVAHSNHPIATLNYPITNYPITHSNYPITQLLHHQILRLSLLTLFVLLLAAPARAQFQPQPLSDPATGESYHVEGAAGFWFPTSDISIESQSLGIIGSAINFKRDLGLTDTHFAELHLEVRPSRRHKFRFQYIPIKYEQAHIVTRDIIFNGQLYRVGVAVNSTLDWKAYRFGYEYDFVSRDRLFAGFVLDLKYTDLNATLLSPIVSEFTTAQAPIPAIGGIIRYYPVPNVSVTGEVTGFRLPESLIKDTTGHYFDVDIYGTLNFTNYVGVQFGYRKFDVGYLIRNDSGALTMKNFFFGIVARY
jgi:hypothetical protein